MKSMTGFAFSESHVIDEKNQIDATISVEIKSYNSRYLEISVNQPFYLSRLEPRLREFISTNIQRGKVELSIRIKERSSNLSVVSDVQAAREYMKAIKEIAQTIEQSEDIPLSVILAQEGVLKTERTLDIESYWNMILPIVEKTFDEYDTSRTIEGKALASDVFAMIDRIETSVILFENRLHEMERIFRENLKAKFTELLGSNIDEQRIMQETASLLMKYTINEEIVRLKAHLTSLKKELMNNPSPGRKTDFICQEINREINTIGSKNQLVEIGEAVIDAKDALENIREQMRNIE